MLPLICASPFFLALLATNQHASAQSTPSVAGDSPSAVTSRSASALPLADHVDLQAALPEPARADYESGMMLYEADDHWGALLKFQLAYGKSADPHLLWNIAVCEKALRHYARALPLIHRYLNEAAPTIGSSEREEAEELAKAIAEFVGPVRIESSQPGASVKIDDTTVGKTPLSELLDMGDRKVTVSKRGFKEATTLVRVLGPGSEQRVFVRLERDIPAATLEVVAGARQAISVDDNTVGRGRWEGLVSPGKHVIRVSGAGYKTKEVQADLSNGGRVSIWVVAQPLEPSSKSTRWPLVAVLGSATVVVAILAYYGLRPAETRASMRVTEGRLDTRSVDFAAVGSR